MIIIPAINCPDGSCVARRLETVRAIGADYVQFDVADGAFTPGWVTWNEPETLEDISFEAHLMVSRPQDDAERWLAAGAMRVIFHLESDYDLGALERLVREYDAHLMAALNPATPLSALERVPGVGEVLLLGVTPGQSGQKFRRETIAKARELLARDPDVTIEIDGGVTPPVAREARELGAWGVAVGSYLFESEDPVEAYGALWNS